MCIFNKQSSPAVAWLPLVSLLEPDLCLAQQDYHTVVKTCDVVFMMSLTPSPQVLADIRLPITVCSEMEGEDTVNKLFGDVLSVVTTSPPPNPHQSPPNPTWFICKVQSTAGGMCHPVSVVYEPWYLMDF
jgi:hypothetical protein